MDQLSTNSSLIICYGLNLIVWLGFRSMAGAVGTSMLGSFLVFTVILSLQEIYRGKLASSELFTILGGFTSSLLFLFSLTVSSSIFYFILNVRDLLFSCRIPLHLLLKVWIDAVSFTCSSLAIFRNLLASRVVGVQVCPYFFVKSYLFIRSKPLCVYSTPLHKFEGLRVEIFNL